MLSVMVIVTTPNINDSKKKKKTPNIKTDTQLS